MSSPPPPLFPPPRQVDLGDQVAPIDPVTVAHDPSLPRQGYRLTLRADGTTLEHADALGRRYGEATLEHLRRMGGRVGTVEDHPEIAERGFMLDISRDRVPTMDTLRWLVGLLGRLRYTELQLYTEHTFAWPEHEIVWRDASPMTTAEMATLAAVCAEHGLRLVPCLNGFGHMERFLRHDRYRHRAECPDGTPAIAGDGIAPPTTLAPTEDNAAFALDLFRAVLDAAPSERVHIGGDEPFDLGLGRSAADVARRGKAAVYVEHLRRLIEPLAAEGLETLFWGDVLVGHPELAAALPATAVPVAWWYDAPVPDAPPMSAVLGADVVARLGMPEDAMAGFAAHARGYADLDRPFWVAPGTSTWNSTIGRWPNARANIDDAIAVGRDRGATGMLLTDWGDNGHHQPLPISLLPLVHAAGRAWAGDRLDAADRPAAPAVVDDLTGIAGLGDQLVALGGIDAALGVRQFNASALNAIVRGAYRAPRRPRIDAGRVDAALGVVDEAIAFATSAATASGGRAGIIATELDAAARLARHGIWRLAAHHDLPAPDPDVLEADRRDVVVRQRAAWLASSRGGGLADSIGRLAI